MDNILGAALGVVFLLLSIACFPIGFALASVSPFALPAFFILGILFLSATLPVPIFILDKLDGRS